MRTITTWAIRTGIANKAGTGHPEGKRPARRPACRLRKKRHAEVAFFLIPGGPGRNNHRHEDVQSSRLVCYHFIGLPRQGSTTARQLGIVGRRLNTTADPLAHRAPVLSAHAGLSQQTSWSPRRRHSHNGPATDPSGDRGCISTARGQGWATNEHPGVRRRSSSRFMSSLLRRVVPV